MQKIIDTITRKLIDRINSKENPRKVAWQFILEELDAAKESTNILVKKRIETFYIQPSEYNNAMAKSWKDVDGPNGPQHYLLSCMIALSAKIDLEIIALLRITIVEYILKHYNFGRYFKNNGRKNGTNRLNLFEIIAQKDKLHSNFKALMDDSYALTREIICQWSEDFIDRDNKFVYEFQTTFNSSFWELYLHQAFKDLKMNVDFSQQSPDFNVKTSLGHILNIEAVTANHAQDSEPEWGKIDVEKLERTEFLRFACIRLLNAISSKYRKYKNTYSKLSHVKDNPYIIAVAPFEQPFFFTQNNEAIIRVLYGQGIKVQRGADGVLSHEEEYTPYVVKDNEVNLPLGLFTNDQYKEISAIIFSTTATISKANVQSNMNGNVRVSRYDSDVEMGLIMDLIPNENHYETHLDGLQIHHNPFAEIPLDINEFSKYEITHYFYDPVNKIIDNQQKNYTIISRSFFH